MALAEELPSSPWSSDLPPKFAADVLRRLRSHADHVSFAAVCRSWRAAARHQPRPPPLWLALPDGAMFSFPESTPLKLPRAASYHGSCNDWLMFRRDGDAAAADDDGYLLLNPFSGATMRLPGLSRVRFVVRDGVQLTWKGIKDDRRAPRDTSVRKMVMCPRQIVAAIAGDGVRLGKIVMWRPGTDFWCVSAHDAWRGFTDIAYHDGMVYAVEDNGDLFAMVFGEDDHTGGAKVAWAKLVIKGSTDASVPPPSSRKAKPDRTTRYLFVSGGRLTMVRRMLRNDGTAAFAVFEADFVVSRWTEVTSIGDDTALFVGRWNSFSLRVRRYGLPGNRILFLDDDALCRRDRPDHYFGAYDMRDGVTYPLLPQLDVRNGADTPATWLFPSRERMPSWCDLPADVFRQVLRFLLYDDDRVRLGVVCRDWHVSVRQHVLPGRRRAPLPNPGAGRQHVLPRRRGPPPNPGAGIARPPANLAAVRRSAFWRAGNLAYLALPDGMVFRYPELTVGVVNSCAGYCGAARDGWLLFHDDDGLLRLRSPFMGETRLLPSLDDGVRAREHPTEIVDDRAPTGRAVATSGRWRDGEGMDVQKLAVRRDGLVAAIVGREHFGKLALCSLETFSWSLSAHDRWRWYEDLAFHDGTLYALTADEDLIAFDVGFDVTTGDPMVTLVRRIIVGSGTSWYDSVGYLVPSCSGELLMVRRRIPPDGAMQQTVRFTVSRADFASRQWTWASRQWTAVNILGGGDDDEEEEEALFVGRHCSRAVRLPGGGGQIFFLTGDFEGMSFWDGRTHGGTESSNHAAVYDVASGTVTDILHLPQQQLSDGQAQATWLFPPG
ncbi:hypothetical protein ACP70R_025389 [Stipagrostis hirtigluma subsp. patula]